MVGHRCAAGHQRSARSPPPPDDREEATSKIRRTDILLGASVAVAAATTAVGLLWVDWEQAEVQTALVPTREGGWATVKGRF